MSLSSAWTGRGKSRFLIIGSINSRLTFPSFLCRTAKLGLIVLAGVGLAALLGGRPKSAAPVRGLLGEKLDENESGDFAQGDAPSSRKSSKNKKNKKKSGKSA